MRSIQAYYCKFKLAGGLTMPYVEAAIRSLLMSGLTLYNGSANYQNYFSSSQSGRTSTANRCGELNLQEKNYKKAVFSEMFDSTVDFKSDNH